MAKATQSLPILPLVLLFLFFNFGILKPANGQPGKTWCIAKPSTNDSELAGNIIYACSNVNATSCNIIQEGGACSVPNTTISRASVAMNIYYQAMGRNAWNCDFKGSGVITVNDPSFGNCKYA